jgi:catechol 2,3-dioxygenase
MDALRFRDTWKGLDSNMPKALATPSQTTTNEIATFGAVHLDVHHADEQVAFWRDIIGMHVRRQDPDAIELGTPSQTLITLHPGARTPARKGFSGLYHLAVHAADAAEFARIAARLLASGIRIAPTDHTMTKSLYLEDPDGMAVEVALETPERFPDWRVHIEGRDIYIVDDKGQKRSPTQRLDMREVLSHLPGDADAKLRDGTKVGHVHLYVRDVPSAAAFYEGLGFSRTSYYPQLAMADFGAGGVFKHRIATNGWMGPDAPQAPPGTAGMRHYTIQFADHATLDAALAKHPEAIARQDGYLVSDPSGNKVLLTRSA